MFIHHSCSYSSQFQSKFDPSLTTHSDVAQSNERPLKSTGVYQAMNGRQVDASIVYVLPIPSASRPFRVGPKRPEKVAKRDQR